AAGKSPAPLDVRAIHIPNFYPVTVPTLETLAPAKLELLRRGDRAARAYDPRIVKVQASFAEELKEILVVTSDGKLVRDRQPLMRFGVHAIAEDQGKRQGGSGGGGGRFG